MLSLICILIGINPNPKVQEIIDQKDLPNYGAMKCLSKLMDIPDIQEVLPNLGQLNNYLSHKKKKKFREIQLCINN